jgi:hypothetical protein
MSGENKGSPYSQKISITAFVDPVSVRSILEANEKGKAIPQATCNTICTSLGITQPKNLVFVTTWKDLVSNTVAMLLEAKQEVYIASRYFDIDVSMGGLKAAVRGCKIHSLHSARYDRSTIKDIVELEARDPRAERVFKSLATNPNVTLEEAGLEFSFVVMDSRKVGIELVNPSSPEKFFASLSFENQDFALKLIAFFNEIEKVAITDRRLKMI